MSEFDGTFKMLGTSGVRYSYNIRAHLHYSIVRSLVRSGGQVKYDVLFKFLHARFDFLLPDQIYTVSVWL